MSAAVLPARDVASPVLPPTEGEVCRGRLVTLGWPEAAEFDDVTALRNRAHVRTAFLDPRPLDPQANRDWLAHGMKRPQEAVLAIRFGASRTLVGTIGWSGFDPHARTFELGRLIVDARRLLPMRATLPADYPGVAVDATEALTRYAFEVLGLSTVTSVHLAERRLSRRVHRLMDGRVTGTSVETRRDGSTVDVVRYAISRDEWLARFAKAPA